MKVSLFRNFSQVVENLELDVILEQIRSGKYKARIQLLRELIRQGKTDEYNDKKRTLPAFTPSGMFKGGRKLEFLKEYSGCLILDIDHLPQDQLSDAKSKASEIPFTHACFISPGGQGLKILVKVFNRPVFHKQTWEQVKDYYEEKLNHPVDPSGKDITRLCFVSWDEFLYLNPSSAVFKAEINKVEDDIEKVVRQIESRNIDITSGYQDWLRIAFSLIDGLGEEARDYFHRISKFNPGYDPAKCNAQFDKCLASTGDGISINSFFYLVKEKGIDISPPGTPPLRVERGLGGEAGKERVKGGEVTPPSPKWLDIERFLSDNFEFRNNTVAHVIEYREKSGSEFKEINENSLHRFLQLSGVKFSLSQLKSLLQSDFIEDFDPISDYFTSLPPWDKETDHITALAGYVNAKDQSAFNHHFKKMLVRCVACALKEFYYNKQAFIIVGYRQNTGKSTWIRFLCPPKLSRYIYENISTDKDAMMCLSENFIINLDELAIFDKKEINYLKSLLSKDRVKIRRPFATRATSDARRASFFGSTNNNVFLTDETGSVRWLCFEIESIDFSYIQKIDIDQVWAQAYYLFQNDFKYELSPAEIKENERRNEQFQHLSYEYELIQKTYLPGDTFNNSVFLTATDILQDLTAKYTLYSRLSVEKIGKALIKQGFQKIPRRKDSQSNPVYGYFVKISA